MREEYLKYIENLDIGNMKSERIVLSPQFKSTKIMTRLKHRSDNDIIDQRKKDAIDVLYVTIHSQKPYIHETLVMLYIPRCDLNNFQHDWEVGNRRMVFTKFKKKAKSYWRNECWCTPYAPVQLTNGMVLRVWDNPYIIEAATDYDKDFRKEWIDGFLEYEGNEYGDTSDFYIIGCLE